MKKYAMILLMALMVTSLKAGSTEYKDAEQATENSLADVQQMAERVYEINDMDMSTLSSTERYELKYELIQIKSKLNTFLDNGGIYIGGGTLLIIIILLILLL